MRRLVQSGLAAGVAAALLVPAAPALAASGGSDASSGLAPVGSAAAVPSSATALGAVPGDQTVSFDVVLKPRDQAALDEFVRDVSTPGSPQYHQFLKTGEFDNRFGATPQAANAVADQMKRLGLNVDSVDGSIVHVSGSATAVASALHTSFKRYRLTSGRLVRANVAAPEVSTTVSPYVQGIVGLDTLIQAHHPTPTVTAQVASVATAEPNTSTPSACFTEQTSGGYSANQIASYYGLDSYWNAGDFGTGITIAMFELESYTQADVVAYQDCYGTSTSVSNVSVDGGSVADPDNPYPGLEATLDIEGAIGLAPAASIRVYEGPNSVNGVLDTYKAIANANIAQVVSTSWGICEPVGSAENPTAGVSPLTLAERQVFQQMAAQGQTIFAASGDQGSAGCDTNPPGTTSALAVDDPASQPEVTGVGGTNLTSSTGPEAVWNNGLDSNNNPVGGGGGISSLWTMPAWQAGDGITADSSGTPCGAPAGSYCREVPDVSASADPDNGYVVAYDVADHPNSLIVVGGTSAAAPMWASLVALIDSSCTGKRLGLINPALYALSTQDSSAFNDITSGDNDAVGTNGGAYPAGSGYDMATGLGTPAGAEIGSDLCTTPATAGAGTMSVDKASVPAASTTTLTFTYTLPAGNGIADGELDITVPAGWSTPSTTSTSAGYTTSSLGEVSVSSAKIEVKGLTAIAGSSFTVTYGDTSGGGAGAAAPTTARESTFAAAVSGSYGVVPASLVTSPSVVVWTTAAPGQGTMSVDTPAVLAGEPTTLTFTYAPPANTKLVNGTVTIDVPATWTAPQASDSSAAAYVTVNTGTLSTTGTQITVGDVDLDLGDDLVITYGAAGHGGTAPAPGSSTFDSTQGGSALAQSPVVTTYDIAPDGAGSLTVSPSSVTPGSDTTLTFTYTAPADGFVTDGELTIDVPGDWSAPRTSSGAAGEVTASGGTVTVTGQTIKLMSIDLSPSATLTITYGTTEHGGAGAKAPSDTGSAIFKAQQRSTSSGSLTDLPDVTVSVAPPPSGGGGGGGGGAFGHPDLARVAGADRIATSVAASQAAFPKASSARVAVLARSDSFADALAGTPLAARDDGPLLLTMTAALPTITATELNRVLPLGSTVYLLGGTSAVSPSVQDALAGMGYSVTRLAGADRYATAVAVADAQGDPTTVFEADGTNFPDALSAGSAAAREGAAVLLTAHATQSAVTAAYLAAHPSVRYAVGGPAAKADPGATPLVGADRYATSVAVATKFFNAPLSVGLASGMNFPDALSGGAVAANHGGPILLVPSTGAVSAATTFYLTQIAALSASSAWLFGGTASVSDGVFSQAAAALKATAP